MGASTSPAAGRHGRVWKIEDLLAQLREPNGYDDAERSLAAGLIEAQWARIRALEATMLPLISHALGGLSGVSKGSRASSAPRDRAATTIGDLRRALSAVSTKSAIITGDAYDLANRKNVPVDGAGGIPIGSRAKPSAPSHPSPDDLSEDGKAWIAAIVREAGHGLR